MSFRNPLFTLIVGFLLLLVGLLLPILMVMRILESTFFLNFLAYIVSFLGVMLGIVGSIMIASRGRKQ